MLLGGGILGRPAMQIVGSYNDSKGAIRKCSQSTSLGEFKLESRALTDSKRKAPG